MEADPQSALKSLRDSWRLWRELEVPYEGARAREMMGIAARRLGDEDTAQMELDAPRWVFRQLGAVQDLAAVDQFLRNRPAQIPGA